MPDRHPEGNSLRRAAKRARRVARALVVGDWRGFIRACRVRAVAIGKRVFSMEKSLVQFRGNLPEKERPESRDLQPRPATPAERGVECLVGLCQVHVFILEKASRGVCFAARRRPNAA